MDKNDVAAEIADKNDAAADYTWGLHKRSLAGMVLVTLLFVPLAAVLLCRLPAAPAPVAGTGTTLAHSATIVWTVSLLICSYLSFWIYTFSRTMGAAAVFLRVSYPAALACAAADLAGPATGVAAAHLATAWAAGLLGYALAEHRMRDGGAAGEAAARAAGSRGGGGQSARRLGHGVFMASLVTIAFAPLGAVWVSFFVAGDTEGDTCFQLAGLSVLVCWILYFWVAVVNIYFLDEALVSHDFMIRVYYYFMGSCVLGVLCALVSIWLFVYFLGLEMMAMAAFFGYTLAVNARCKEILARDQPLHKDLELGDVAQESASASTGENA